MSAAMLTGAMRLWFVLTGISVLFVAMDIKATPESPVLKWAFVLTTAYTGVVGALLYVLGCREPLPGLHERYVASRWRQTLGSTMHCVAGDGVGILAGAVLGSVVHLTGLRDVALEYVLGFAFGWTIFQALFMKDMAGSYGRSLARTFVPEFVSMNALMAAMVPVMTLTMVRVPGSHDPASPLFWFVMSMSLIVGFVAAYPANWWLVTRHLKHGMMTVRRPDVRPARSVPGMTTATAAPDMGQMTHRSEDPRQPPPGRAAVAVAAAVSIGVFGAGVAISMLWGGR